MRLGQILRKWRVTSKLTLRSVAAEIGVLRSTLSRFELGHEIEATPLSKIVRWAMAETGPFVPAVPPPSLLDGLGGGK